LNYQFIKLNQYTDGVEMTTRFVCAIMTCLSHGPTTKIGERA